MACAKFLWKDSDNLKDAVALVDQSVMCTTIFKKLENCPSKTLSKLGLDPEATGR